MTCVTGLTMLSLCNRTLKRIQTEYLILGFLDVWVWFGVLWFVCLLLCCFVLSWSPDSLLCLHKINVNILLEEEFVCAVEPKAAVCLELL